MKQIQKKHWLIAILTVLCLVGSFATVNICRHQSLKPVVNRDTWETQNVIMAMENFTLAKAMELDEKHTSIDGTNKEELNLVFRDVTEDSVSELESSENFYWSIKGKGISAGSSHTPEQKDSVLYGTFTIKDGKIDLDGNLAQYGFDPVHSNSLIEWISSQEDFGDLSLKFPEGLTFTYSIPSTLVPEENTVYYSLVNNDDLITRLIALYLSVCAILALVIFFANWQTEKEIRFFKNIDTWPIGLEVAVLFFASMMALAAVIQAAPAYQLLQDHFEGDALFHFFPAVLVFLAALAVFVLWTIDMVALKGVIKNHGKERFLIYRFANQLSRNFNDWKWMTAIGAFYWLFLFFVMVNGAWALCWFAMVLMFFLFLFLFHKIGQDRNVLMEEAKRLEAGNFTQEKQEAGLFQPEYDALVKVGDGMEQAVKERIESVNMKNELVANVSHDLKTPLTGLKNYVELMETTEDPAEIKDYAKRAGNYATRLESLVTDLFDVSKANSGNLELEPVSLDLARLLQDLAEEHEDTLSQKELTLVKSLPEGINIRLDPDKTMRIFDNLLGNVEKYALPGTRVFLDLEEEEKDGISVSVKNISEAPLNLSEEQVTERFVRGDKSRHQAGAGLGLAIAKSFSEAQGGHLEIKIDGDLFKAVVHLPR